MRTGDEVRVSTPVSSASGASKPRIFRPKYGKLSRSMACAKGGRQAAEVFMKALKLAAIETHVADARTCCLNPATSTHRQMTDAQLAAAGVPAGLVRMSCGLENSADLIEDIAQALEQVQ